MTSLLQQLQIMQETRDHADTDLKAAQEQISKGKNQLIASEERCEQLDSEKKSMQHVHLLLNASSSSISLLPVILPRLSYKHSSR